MPDNIQRMYQEAHDRLHDADILAQSLSARSDSQAIIRILAFEVLLKCALLICDRKPKATHNYKKLWLDLPGYAQNPDGHFKFPHFWPVKLPHGRTVGL